MKLPNHLHTQVPKAKITEYLLSTAHREGKGKAIFFLRFGFSVDTWQDLADALRDHAARHDVTLVEQTPFGMRYVVEGSMQTPDGRKPLIRSVWFIETGEDIPRFVTAYPLARGLS